MRQITLRCGELGCDAKDYAAMPQMMLRCDKSAFDSANECSMPRISVLRGK
jgi:hypothetical protein